MLGSKIVLAALLFLANSSWINCNGPITFIDTFLYRGSSCQLSDGSVGVCDTYCFYNGTKLERDTFCSYEKDYQLLCCKTNVRQSSHPAIEKICQEQIQAAREEHKLGENKEKGSAHSHIAVLGLAAPDGTEWNCEGSLIHPSFVLTSAHCILKRQPPPNTVHVGTIVLNKGDSTGISANYTVLEILVHKQYTPDSRYNDIALLRVKKINADWNTASPRPACIWTKPELPSQEVQTVGYHAAGLSNNLSNLQLYGIKADILEARECNKHFEVDNSLFQGIIDSQICAIDTINALGMCQDNYGSLMQFNHPDAAGQPYLVGIGNFGKSCTDGANLVYTRLYSHLDWIEGILQRSESETVAQQRH